MGALGAGGRHEHERTPATASHNTTAAVTHVRAQSERHNAVYTDDTVVRLPSGRSETQSSRGERNRVVRREALLGRVVSSYGDSDEETDSDEEEDEGDTLTYDMDGNVIQMHRGRPKLQPAQVRVVWRRGDRSTVESMSDLIVVDRDLYPGEAVMMKLSARQRVGTVIDVRMMCDVREMETRAIKGHSYRQCFKHRERDPPLPSEWKDMNAHADANADARKEGHEEEKEVLGRVRRNVSGAALRRVRPIRRDRLILYKDNNTANGVVNYWIGSVIDVLDEAVTIRFDDGAVVEVFGVESDRDLQPSVEDDVNEDAALALCGARHDDGYHADNESPDEPDTQQRGDDDDDEDDGDDNDDDSDSDYSSTSNGTDRTDDDVGDCILSPGLVITNGQAAQLRLYNGTWLDKGDGDSVLTSRGKSRAIQNRKRSAIHERFVRGKNKGTVTRVRLTGLDVFWRHFCGSVVDDKVVDNQEHGIPTYPPRFINGNRLRNVTRFTAFNHHKWDYGDVVYMSPNAEDIETLPPIKLKGRASREIPGIPSCSEHLVRAQIIKTHVSVDVEWEDGRIERDVRSTMLHPSLHTGEHDFLPGDYVMLTNDDFDLDDNRDDRTSWNRDLDARVVRVDSANRTAKVQILELDTSDPAKPTYAFSSELREVSVYQLREHESFNFMIGHIVWRLSDANKREEVAKRGLPASYARALDGGHDNAPVGIVGEVVGRANDGQCIVQWTDKNNTRSNVWPWMVYGINPDDDDSDDGYSSSSSYESVEPYVPQMVSQATRNNDNDEPYVPQMVSQATRNNDNYELYVPQMVSQATRNNDNDEASDGSWETVDEDADDGDNNEEEIPSDVEAGAVAPDDNDNDNDNEDEDEDAPPGLMTDEEMNRAGEEREEEEEEEEQKPSSSSQQREDSSSSPMLFDDMSDSSDHYFLNDLINDVAGGGMGNEKQFQRRIMHEYALLQKGLPPSIYVRCYEEYTRLLRCAIVGPDGTPYEKLVFVFDLYLPPSYPNIPPQCYYHSYGYRVNPNLYQNGKVCLSLLNTWNGTRTEKWDGQKSNILQILLSIQALVLVEDPYFNEAGYMKQKGSVDAAHNSKLYNEQSRLESLRTTVMLLRKPPVGMRPILTRHIIGEKDAILAATDAVVVADGNVEPSRPQPTSDADAETAQGATSTTPAAGASSSSGFKTMLTKLLKRLETQMEAFSSWSRSLETMFD